MAVVEGVQLKVEIDGDEMAVRALGDVEEAQKSVESSSESMKQEVVESSQTAAKSIDEASAKAISAYDSMQEAQQNVFSDLVEQTGQGTRRLESMEAAYAELGQRAELTASDLQGATLQARRTGSALQSAGGSARGAANNLGFELV